MDTGSQVGSINNVQTIGTSLSISETVGVLREKAYATNDQLFAPGSNIGHDASAFGNYFPGVTINDAIGDQFDSSDRTALRLGVLRRWPSARIPNTREQTPACFRTASCPPARPSGPRDATRVSFGGSCSYTQLNTRDHRTGTGNVDTPDFVTFANNWVTPYSTQTLYSDLISAGQRQSLLSRQ